MFPIPDLSPTCGLEAACKPFLLTLSWLQLQLLRVQLLAVMGSVMEGTLRQSRLRAEGYENETLCCYSMWETRPAAPQQRQVPPEARASSGLRAEAGPTGKKGKGTEKEKQEGGADALAAAVGSAKGGETGGVRLTKCCDQRLRFGM